MLRRWITIFAISLGAITALMAGGILWLQRDLPSPTRLETIEPTIGTTVYARDGRVLH